MFRNAVVVAPVMVAAISMSALNADATLLLQYTFDGQNANDSVSHPTFGAANGNLINDDGAASTVNGGGTGPGFTTNTPSGTGFAFSTGDGIDNYITTGVTTSQTTIDNETNGSVPSNKLDSLASFTLMTWINMRSTPGAFDRIMSKKLSSGSDGFELSIENVTSATNYGVKLSVDSGSTTPVTVNSGSLGEWVFLAVTYDGTVSSNNVKFYIGGMNTVVSQIGSALTLNLGAVGNSGATFQVGGTSATTLDRSSSAYFDDVRVFGASDSTGTLTLAELEAIRVPEPATIGLAGIASLLFVSRRRTK